MDNLNSIFGDNLMKYFQGIDFESFACLREDQIKEAIPDVIPRIMFENRFKKFLETINKTPAADGASFTENRPICVIIDENTPTTSTFLSQDFQNFDKDFDLFNSVSGPVMVSKTILSSQEPLKKPLAIKTIQDIVDIPSIELKIVIKKCVENKDKVENYDRVVIGKEIIHHLLVNDLDRLITKTEFLKLAKLIVQLLPNELEGTYYLPSVKGSQTQGKLYTAFANYRTQLKAVGLIEKKRIESEHESDEEVERAQLEEKSDALKFVLEDDSDFDHIKICWQACHNERRKLLEEFSVFEYIRRFPSFSLPSGYELLTLDADTVLLEKRSTLLEIAPKIIAYATPKKKTTLEIRSLLAAFEELIVGLEIESIEFQTVQQLIAIRLLPFVVPNPKKKLSKSEIERLFCPYFKTALAADKHNSIINQEFKDDSTILKPRCYFFGDVSNPCATIWISDKKYTFENSITAFDTLFKSFVALQCPYPEKTEHIWQFVEKVIYGLEISKRKKMVNVEAFIHDIKQL